MASGMKVSAQARGWVRLTLSLAPAALLASCATPRELKQPINHPVMGAVSAPDPLPAAVTPEPEFVPDKP